jgi:hypothetical protein
MEKEETGKMAEDKGKKGLLTPLKKGKHMEFVGCLYYRGGQSKKFGTIKKGQEGFLHSLKRGAYVKYRKKTGPEGKLMLKNVGIQAQ